MERYPFSKQKGGRFGASLFALWCAIALEKTREAGEGSITGANAAAGRATGPRENR